MLIWDLHRRRKGEKPEITKKEEETAVKTILSKKERDHKRIRTKINSLRYVLSSFRFEREIIGTI